MATTLIRALPTTPLVPSPLLTRPKARLPPLPRRLRTMPRFQSDFLATSRLIIHPDVVTMSFVETKDGLSLPLPGWSERILAARADPCVFVVFNNFGVNGNGTYS